MSAARRDLAELLRLAGPVIGTRLGVMAMGLTDTVVVGRYSATELGYMALGWAPTIVVMTTATGLLSGVQVMTARGHPGGAVLRRGLVYAFWLGVGTTAVMLAFGPALLRASGIEPDLAAGGGRALRVFALSGIASLLGVVMSWWLEALGRPVLAMGAMWFANAVNLALDLVLVPGRFGVPAMGAVGAGWSTFSARVAFMLVLAVLIVRLPQARALGVFARPPRDRAAEAEQRRIGYGAGAAFFAETSAFSGMNIVAGWVGGLAVAGWAIALNVASIVFMVPMGLAVAASVLVARAYGADDRPAVARAGALGFGVAVALLGAVSLAVWAFAGPIAGLYTTDPRLAAVSAGALRLACLFFVVDGLQVVTSQMLRARGDVWLPTWVQIASYVAVMLPLGWALALPAGMGLTGIMWAVIAASFMSAGLLVSRFVWLARPFASGSGAPH
jgi:MATE family multidrug resistance protein